MVDGVATEERFPLTATVPAQAPTTQRVTTQVRLSGALDVLSLEEGLLQQTDVRRWGQPLLIDLTDVTWIDVAAILHLTALFRARLEAELATTLRLPSRRKVRDFFRAWNVSEGMKQALNMPFRRLVHPDDWHYFGEGQTAYLPYQYPSPFGAGISALESQRFFGLRVYPNLNAQARDVMLHDGCAQWQDPLVANALTSLFPGLEGEIPRVLIYEALSNARQHPHSNLVCTISRFDEKWRGKPVETENEQRLTASGRTQDQLVRHGMFTICVWDDGLSIVQTLRKSIDSDLPLRFNIPGEQFAEKTFLVKLDRNTVEFTTVPATSTPDRSTSDELVLLSSLLPGITRKASSPFEPDPLFDDVPHTPDEPGMGLYALTRSIVNDFGGSLAFRSGNLFMNVRRPNRYDFRTSQRKPPVDLEHWYYAKIKPYTGAASFISGNMLTIRIPIHYRIDADTSSRD